MTCDLPGTPLVAMSLDERAKKIVDHLVHQSKAFSLSNCHYRRRLRHDCVDEVAAHLDAVTALGRQPLLQRLRQAVEWVPVASRLPTEDDKIMVVTVVEKGVFSTSESIGYDVEAGQWFTGRGSVFVIYLNRLAPHLQMEVVAWMPCPEPWKPT